MKKTDLEKLIKECVVEILKENQINVETASKEDLINYLNSTYGGEDGFKDSVEVALYWFANDYHGGQNSELYSILSTSPYRPSRINRGGIDGEDDELAKMMYGDLEYASHKNGSDKQQPDETVQEAKNELGETQYTTYQSWLRAVKQIDPSAKIDGDKDIASANGLDGKPIGQWEGDVGSIFKRDDVILIKPKDGKAFKSTWPVFKRDNAEGFSPQEMEQLEKELNEKGQFTVGGGAAQQFTVLKKVSKSGNVNENDTPPQPDQTPAKPESEIKRTVSDFEGGKKPRGLSHNPIKVKVKLELKARDNTKVLTPSQDIDVYFSDTLTSSVYLFSAEKWWSINLQNCHKYLTKFSAPPSISKLESMSNNGIISTPIGNKVEPDGKGPNGDPSWLLVMGLI